MTTKADFNAEEWDTVVQAPLLAGLRVATAERGGTIRESLAMGQAYTEARNRQGTSALLDDLVSSPPMMDPRVVSQAGGDVATLVRERLTDAVRLIEAKGDAAEADAYKQFVLALARAVAGASKEGGFLGIGGKPVSHAEQAAVDELASVLGT